MSLWLRSSHKGYVFTLEAALSLICFSVLALSLAAMSFPDMGHVIMYKQASDVLEVSLRLGCIAGEKDVDVQCIKKLMDEFGMRGEIAIDGSESVAIGGRGGSRTVVVKRSLVTPGLEYKAVELKAFY